MAFHFAKIHSGDIRSFFANIYSDFDMASFLVVHVKCKTRLYSLQVPGTFRFFVKNSCKIQQKSYKGQYKKILINKKRPSNGEEQSSMLKICTRGTSNLV